MKLNIQIASLAALQELLKNENGEVSLEIRQNIADEFAKKYIKPLMNDDTIKKTVEKMTKGIGDNVTSIAENIVEQRIGKLTKQKVGYYGDENRYILQLNGEIRREIIDAVNTQMNEYVSKCVENAIATFTPEKINAAIERRVNDLVTTAINDGVRKKMKQIADAAGI